MIIPSNSTAIAELFKKLTVMNNIEITTDNATLDDIKEGTTPLDARVNTIATLTAKNGASWTGSKDVYHHRVSITKMFVGIPVTLDPRDVIENATYGDYADLLGERYGMPFTKDDVTDATTVVGSSMTIKLTIKPGSLVWLPGEQVTITLKVDSNDLAELIRFPVINAFYMSNQEAPTKTNAEVYSYNVIATSAADKGILTSQVAGTAVSAQLAGIIASLTKDPWSINYTAGDSAYSLSGAIVKTKATVDVTDPNQNPNQNTCIGIQLDTAKNSKFVGMLYIYWTP